MLNSFTRTRLNAALFLDGTGSAYLRVPAATTDATISSGEFTVLCAVKSNSGAAGSRDIISNYVTTGNQRSFLVRFSSTDAIQIFTSTTGTGGTTSVGTSSNTFTSTTDYYWIGISVSASESANIDRVKLYVNGASETMGTPTGTYGAPFSNSQELTWGGREGTTSNMDGYLSLPYVIDRPLTATEHSRLYNSGDVLYPPTMFPGEVVSQPVLETGVWDGSQYNFLDNFDSGGADTVGISSGDLFQNAGIYDQ